MKVCFETFGCRLNKAEALQMEADYIAAGWKVVEEHSAADLIVVRGCSVTGRAQRDCEKTIAHIRRKYPRAIVRVCGCLKPDAAAEAASARIASLSPPPSADIPKRTARAYLKVQDGCPGNCTFCIVPKFRGKPVSVPFADVLSKARRFAEAGYREIVVAGCNLSLYSSEGKRLPDLFAALCATTGADAADRVRIRLGSVEPGACAEECAAAMAESRNACRFLHVPVQSGSPVVLKAMKRPYTVRDVESLVMSVRKAMPDVGLGCDLMAGFPGETVSDFAATRSLLQRCAFSNVHVFRYSERPGTPAASFRNVLPVQMRRARADELSREAERTKCAFAKRFFGKTVEIAVEESAAGTCSGRTGEYLRCAAVGAAPRRSLANVLVTKVERDGTLQGVVRP